MGLDHEIESTRGLTMRGVHKSFGREQVLHDLSLDLRPAELTLLLGQNGSGKSTLLRIAAGLSRADQGHVERAERVGYVGHQSLMYAALTVRENLRLAAELAGVGADIDAALQEWNLLSCADKCLSQLSKGQQSRAALARAFLHDPSLLLLDEPTSALDEASTILLIEKLKASSAAILLATHDVARLESHAKRALVLTEGRISIDSAAGDQTTLETVVQRYREINR
ncbi:MAG: ABC transporter ATP-binding protein [Deltaproteobacteria bacterium]|nr:ABC transporter ATP-binding protein [Deltaproteobacteria bacterium]